MESRSRLLTEGQNLAVVALDAKTGRKLWEKPCGSSPGESAASWFGESTIFWFCYKDEILTMTRCPWRGQYEIYALHAADGRPMWSQRHQPLSYNHRAHRRKTVIVGETLLQEPVAYDLRTGAEKWKMEGRINCGNLSASACYLFGATGSTACTTSAPWPGRDRLFRRRAYPWTRPGCNVNMIAAGGLLLTPEASAGCSCCYPVQTSMGFVSK